MAQEFSNDEEESIFHRTSLLKLDWDVIQNSIEKFLNEHMRTWDDYDYFIIDDSTLLIKVYGRNEPVFAIKARLEGDRLVVVDVS
jgi:hypothetical protein